MGPGPLHRAGVRAVLSLREDLLATWPFGGLRDARGPPSFVTVYSTNCGRSFRKDDMGHLLGAAATVELLAAILSIRDGVVHPTINYETPDPECDLDYVPDEQRRVAVEYAMSNSLGFGGHNLAIIIGRLK